MRKRSKAYLDSYREDFMEAERRCRNHCEAWFEILKELGIDRGTLLGSSHYNDLSGVERADALEGVEVKVAISYANIEQKKRQAEEELIPKNGYKHRCARIRKEVRNLSDKALGVKE